MLVCLSVTHCQCSSFILFLILKADDEEEFGAENSDDNTGNVGDPQENEEFRIFGEDSANSVPIIFT